MPLHELVVALNGIVGSYGWGRLDMVENRRVGIKSRETYEAPGGAGDHAGPRRSRVDHASSGTWPREKQRLERRYAELVYDGLWFSPLQATRSTRSSIESRST